LVEIQLHDKVFRLNHAKNITVVSFFIFLAFYILLTALPIQLTKEFGGGADQAGLLVTLFLFAAIVIRPFAGKWVSTGSQKKLLIYSAIAFFAATLLYPFVTNIWVLFILRIVHGLTFGVITTVKGTISAVIIPDSRRGEGLSWFSLAMGLAMVIGPVIGLNLANTGAYNTSYMICILVSAINILLALVINVSQQKQAEKVSKTGKQFHLDDIVDKKAAPFALVIFILACAYSGIANSLFFNSMDLGMAIGAFVLGFAAKSFGYSSVYISGIVLIVAGGIAYFALASKKEKERSHAVGLKSVVETKHK
jgi:predicted MFS family arabinose efflux permease